MKITSVTLGGLRDNKLNVFLTLRAPLVRFRTHVIRNFNLFFLYLIKTHATKLVSTRRVFYFFFVANTTLIINIVTCFSNWNLFTATK